MHLFATTDAGLRTTINARNQPFVPSLEDIFGGFTPLRAAEDLAYAGIFDNGEAEEFITDLYAMRRSDVA